MKFKQIFKTRLLLFVGVVAMFNCFDAGAQNFSEGRFFSDTSGGIPEVRKKTLTNRPGDDSGELNRLISELTNPTNPAGGGIITIPAGTWELGEINVKSNIHIRINKNAIIKPKLTSIANKSIFRIGYSNNKSVNVSIKPYPNGKFTIDMTGIPVETRITPFNVKEAENFLVAGCLVKDKFSIHAALNCSVSKRGNVWRGPKKGLVKDLTVVNGHGGYGGIQVRTGENIMFKRINCTNGGVALRIESDDVGANSSASPPVPQSVAKVSNIYGDDISCKNGNAAVMLQPWGATNGKVFVRNVKAVSCMSAVRIDRAYQGRRGSFHRDSKITDIKCTYGTNAQVKEGVKNWVPCALRRHYSANRIPHMETYHKGPTIAPILYRASNTSGGSNTGFYKVNIPTVTELRSKSSRFPSGSLMISRLDNEVRNCGRLRSATIDADNLEALEGVKIYPNPVVGDNVNVSVALESEGQLTLEVYDFTGKVLSKKLLGQPEVGGKDYSIAKQELNINTKGIYLVKVKCGNKVVGSQKVIVQ